MFVVSRGPERGHRWPRQRRHGRSKAGRAAVYPRSGKVTSDRSEERQNIMLFTDYPRIVLMKCFTSGEEGYASNFYVYLFSKHSRLHLMLFLYNVSRHIAFSTNIHICI